MIYNKLVRDRVLEIIRSKGGNAKSHVADDTEYWQKLKEKLLEEAQEFCTDENPSEIADIQEVLLAIIEHKQFTKEEIERIRQQKWKERGGFEKRIILEES